MTEERGESRGEQRQSFFAKQQLIVLAKKAFDQLSAVLRASSLYPAAHPFLLSTAEKFLATFTELAGDTKEAAFHIIAGELFFETYSIPVDQNLAILIEDFTVREIGGLTFKPGIAADELILFAALLNKAPELFTREPDINHPLVAENIKHIDVHRIMLVDKKMTAVTKEGNKKAAEIFMDAIHAVKEIVHAVQRGKMTNARKINTVVQNMIDSILENTDAFMGLTSIKMYDEYTFAHSVNTAILAVSFGTFLSFEKLQVAALGVSALLHDIGKVSVPIDIINKPGKLTDEEWEIVRRHPIEGAMILSDIPGVTKLAMVAAFEHHRHGAEGYPRVEDAAGQHPFSKIVALADAYEALTAARVYYHTHMSADQAIRVLIGKRSSVFEPTLVKAFVNMVGFFPIGTILKLDTGEIGLVEHQTGDLVRPRVLLLDRMDGSEKEAGERVSLLETAGGQYKRTAVGTINPYSARIDIKKYLA